MHIFKPSTCLKTIANVFFIRRFQDIRNAIKKTNNPTCLRSHLLSFYKYLKKNSGQTGLDFNEVTVY